MKPLMPQFPTTFNHLMGGVEVDHKTERAAVPEDRRRPTVTPTGISQNFDHVKMRSNFMMQKI